MTLTPLAVAALGLLFERPMHPYEMFQLLMSRRDDRLVKVRPGSLYHAIDRLAEAGLVAAQATERAGNRPERTLYALTPEGANAARQWLRDEIARPADEYPPFPLAVSQAHNLPQAETVALLRERIAALRADLDVVDGDIEAVTGMGVAERHWLENTYQQALLQAQVDWLQTTADRIESGDLVWEPRESEYPRPEGNRT